MAGERLRIAILLENPQSPVPWALRLLERICASSQLELCALLRPTGRVQEPRASPLLRAWLALEGRLAARPQPAVYPAFASVRERLDVLGVDQKDAIIDLKLDVILDLTGRSARSCEANLARHGLWFPDFLTAEAVIAGLRAVIGAEPVTRIALFRMTAEHESALAIAAATLNTKFVAARNALFMCEKGVTLITRELERTQRFGEPAQGIGLNFTEPVSPSKSDLARYAVGLLLEIFARAFEVVLAKLRLRPGMFFLRSAVCDLHAFDPTKAKAFVAEKNKYFADPFLWQHGGKDYCFFERYDYATGKGSISSGCFENGELVDIREVLSTDYHLSFPFLFEEGGTLYMMPETCAARRVEIWRCVAFPDRWERHATALEGVVAADSTLSKIDGVWWLFTNISTDPFEEMNSELHLYQVDGPDLKSLVAHPLNPVVFDTRTARNAGRILEKDGILYRPSQDNSHGTYGYGLNLMRIDRLTPEEYEETLMRKIEPIFERGIIGCHHLDSRSGRTVMDVRKRIGGW